MRVLVVEDNHRVAGFIIKGLQEEHYSVDHAADGDEAVRLARGGVYDAILLDIMLPGRDGFAVTASLRQNGCQTPILMLTAKDSLEDKVRGLDQGADDYLTKPFAFAELLARLRALLRRQSSEAEAVLKLADLTMDPVSHAVCRGGRKIDLTAKEYGVLEFLLRNKNRVVTRTTLIEHVWDMNFDSDTNLVDVYIRYLRKKIDEDFEPKLIQTVRGVGYTLKDS
jgi:heavy metal response regulator